MAHAHDHHHEPTAYYSEQLTTIGICGALGAVAIMLWSRDLLQWILVPKFHLPVLLGGVALLALVIVRAVTVWFSVGKQDGGHSHNHNHDHSHDHDHAHEHCDHDHGHGEEGHEHAHAIADKPHTHSHAHDHGHEHGWAPWRYVILLLPIVLYFLNLPSQGLSQFHGKSLDAGAVALESDGGKSKGQLNVAFLELERASYNPSTRDYYTGYDVKMKGQFQPSPVSAKRFTLFRDKMNCCAGDAIRLNMVIDSPTELDVGALQGRWVEVTGQVTFAKRPGREEYVPALILRKASDVQLTSPELAHYIY
jgi:hypothetical protein